MIYDHIENIEKYANDKKLYAALTSMKNHAEGGEAAGSAECFMSKSEYVTRPIEEAKLENHHKYIDIHYVLSGEEQILIDNIKGAKRLTDYSQEKDCEMFQLTDRFSRAVLTPGTFVVIYPDEGHAPKIATKEHVCQRTEKIVVKIKV